MAGEDNETAGGGPLVGVVGPCGAGKSLLVAALQRRGIRSREIAQEHSYVEDMWRRITAPDLLIYLDVSREVAEKRQGNALRVVMWRRIETRLAHAREHADVVVQTDLLTPEEVESKVLRSLAGLLPGYQG